MMTADMIDVTPLPQPTLADGPLTGYSVPTPDGQLLVGRLLRGGKLYLVSVGDRVKWATAETVEKLVADLTA